MRKIKYIEVNQPIGTFYLVSMPAEVIAKITETQPRSGDPNAIQRDESVSRINDIANYCDDSDATFPTPIIVSIYSEANVIIDENYIEFDDSIKIGEIIDGQHRMKGLIKSNKLERFELPIILMFNLTNQEKAYVFSIINSKQTRVSMSLIYDLFALSEHRSPYKTCHETARALNRDEQSPFFNRLKMLGKKNLGQDIASLSQGTFVNYMLELITKDADEDTRKLKRNVRLDSNSIIVLREYFIKEQDTIIYKIMFNLFSGVKDAFEEEWENPSDFILSKSIGFAAVIRAFPSIYRKGDLLNDLTRNFFREEFLKVKKHLHKLNIELTSNYFGSNEQAIKKLSNLIIEGINIT